jgi:hypothetical protein
MMPIQQPEATTPYTCENCNKSYCDRSGLWRHSKKCKPQVPEHSPWNNEVMELQNTFLVKDKEIEMLREQIEMLKSQNELLIKQMSTPQINNVDMSNNKVENKQTFNLNFYLNETCKNAITMKQFIEKIPTPQLSEFEKFIVQGKGDNSIHKTKEIASLMKKELEKYPKVERPIQVNGLARNYFYYNADGQWLQFGDDKKSFQKYIDKFNCNLLYNFWQLRKSCSHEYDENLFDDGSVVENSNTRKLDAIEQGIHGNIIMEKLISGIGSYCLIRK